MCSNLVRTALAAALWLGVAADAIAAGGTFTRGCAGRDIQIMMMLEAGSISPQRRTDAMRNMTHARMMCFDGYVADALALYEQIAQNIASDWTLSGQ